MQEEIKIHGGVVVGKLVHEEEHPKKRGTFESVDDMSGTHDFGTN